MLIRSQDKKCLINMNNISICMMDEDAICFSVSAIDNSGHVVTLGDYEAMEKAAKVIDMIQDAYVNAELTGFAIPEFCKLFAESENTKENKILAEEMGKNMESNMVFQMPQEEEVE